MPQENFGKLEYLSKFLDHFEHAGVANCNMTSHLDGFNSMYARGILAVLHAQ